MEDLNAGELQIKCEAPAPSSLALRMRGKSTSREPAKILMPYLTRCLEAVGKNGTVAVHFEQLDHFNSSTIAAIVQFINAAQDKSTHVELHYDGALRWQALSFDALKRVVKAFEQAGRMPVRFVEVRRT